MMRELILRDLSLWECLWQSVVFLVLGLAAGWLLRRRPSRAYAVLLLAMIAAALVPFLSAVVRHGNLGAFPAAPEESAHVRLAPPEPLVQGTAAAPPARDVSRTVTGVGPERSPSAPASISWRAILLSAWSVAALLLLARLVATFLYGARLVRQAQRSGCERIQQAAECTASRLRLANGLQVRASERICSPVVWCWTRPPVLLVPRALGCPDVEWTGVVAHELAHCRRWDHLTGLIAELTASLLPWNPLMWLSRRFLIRLGEQACDDWVVATGQSSEDYAESLLHFRAQRQMAFWPAVVSSKTGLAHRIRRILNDACGNPRAGATWALALSIVVASVGLGVAFAQTRPIEPATDEAQKKTSTITLPAPAPKDKASATAALFRAMKADYRAVKGEDIAELKSAIAQGADLEARNSEGYTPLHVAIRQSAGPRYEMIRLLLEAGANPNAQDPEGQTPLHIAVRDWGIQVVRLLVSGGADVSARDKKGMRPVMIAFEWGNTDMFDLMVARGATVPDDLIVAYRGDVAKVQSLIENGKAQETFEQGLTLLHAAAAGGRKAVVESLLANGLDARSETQAGYTALHYAAAGNQREVAELLLAKGADINAEDGKPTPLHWAVRERHKEMIEWLLAHKANPNADAGDWATPLHWAVWWEDKDMVGLLLSQGGNIQFKTQKYPDSPLYDAIWAGDQAMAELLVAKAGDTRAAKWAPLHAAVVSGNRQAVQDLLDKGADVNVKDEDGYTALFIAASRGHKDVAELLLARGADINVRRNMNPGPGWTSLHIAARDNRTSVAELLVARGADVNLKDTWDATPLHYAAENGEKDIVELLIAKGADVNAKANTWNTTALIAAITNGHEDIAKVLIAKGADVNARARGDYTALHWTANNRARMTGATDIMQLLLAKGADIEAKQEHGATPLACATYDGNVESTKFLLEHGANIEAKLNDGETTPLLRAVSQEHVETARLLLDKGANIHATSRGLTAIHVALLGDRLSNRKSDKEMVGLLIERGLQCPPLHLAAFLGDLPKLENCLNDGTRIDERDMAGFTPLHYAVCGDHPEVVKCLLSKGANVNAKSANGWTPLWFVWPVDMAALLVANGADVRIADERGQTVLHGAVNRDNHRGDKALIELLLKHGADVNAKAASTSVGWPGWTPLHVACRNGAQDIVELLLARGADMNAKTDKGETPMAIAQSNEQGRIVNLLRQRGAKE